MAVSVGRGATAAALALTGVAVFVGLLCLPPHLQTTYTPAQLNVADNGTFFLTETEPTGSQFAWTRGRTSFDLDYLPRKPIRLIATMRSAAVAGGPDVPVRLRVNGREVGQLHPNGRDPAFQSLAVSFIPPQSGTGRLDVAFLAPTFRAPDGRDLGTMIRDVTIDKREAWSGIERRRWLFRALPGFALVALACHLIARRFRVAAFGIAAVVAGVIGCLCGAFFLLLLARIGRLDTNRSWAWLSGCLYLETLGVIGTLGVAWAQVGETARARIRHRLVAPRAWLGMTSPPAGPSVAMTLLIVVVAAAALNMGFIARHNTRDWHPDSAFTLRYDKLAAGWGDKVPAELRQTLARKLADR